MKMKMVRITNNNGMTWKEIWIRDGTYNIEQKRYKLRGFDMKPSIVRKEIVLYD